MQRTDQPRAELRYWGAMSLASMCGANMGDFVSNELRLHGLRGLPLLVLLFAMAVVGQRISERGGEAWYWLAVLVIRAAATNLADWLIGDAGFGYATAATGLAVLLGGIVLVRRAAAPNPADATRWRMTFPYWMTMLTAGVLGTVLGDGMGHVVAPVTIGVPAAAVAATLAVASMLVLRLRGGFVSAASYWTAIVAIRAWGTNCGDIAAFLLSRPASMLLTGSGLLALLVGWPAPPALDRWRKPTCRCAVERLSRDGLVGLAGFETAWDRLRHDGALSLPRLPFPSALVQKSDRTRGPPAEAALKRCAAIKAYQASSVTGADPRAIRPLLRPDG